MECTECGCGGASTFVVQYTVGDTEELTLCNVCRGEFEDGDFIGKIEVKSS